jgi:hypothetical protein
MFILGVFVIQDVTVALDLIQVTFQLRIKDCLPTKTGNHLSVDLHLRKPWLSLVPPKSASVKVELVEPDLGCSMTVMP